MSRFFFFVRSFREVDSEACQDTTSESRSRDKNLGKRKPGPHELARRAHPVACTVGEKTAAGAISFSTDCETPLARTISVALPTTQQGDSSVNQTRRNKEEVEGGDVRHREKRRSLVAESTVHGASVLSRESVHIRRLMATHRIAHV